MISKAKSIRCSKAAILYIMDDKGQAKEVYRNLLPGETAKEIFNELRLTQKSNTRCNKNTYSIVLSPSKEVSFSKDKIEELTVKHMENLGLKNNQWIAYLHKSTQVPHIHIIANRIGFDGIAHKDNYISKKAQTSAHSIAKELGLTTAREIGVRRLRERLYAKKQEKLSLQKEQELTREIKIKKSKGLSL